MFKWLWGDDEPAGRQVRFALGLGGERGGVVVRPQFVRQRRRQGAAGAAAYVHTRARPWRETMEAQTMKNNLGICNATLLFKLLPERAGAVSSQAAHIPCHQYDDSM